MALSKSLLDSLAANAKSNYTSFQKVNNNSIAPKVAINATSNTGKTASSSAVPVGNSFGEYSDLMQLIKDTSAANTAQSASFAREQNSWQEQQNKILMDFNAVEAAKNRDWQLMMSNTAHQREIADLKAAGLNPILSATGGNGAAVTSGATASGMSSSGAKGEVDTSYVAALLNFVSNMMGYATSTASAGISAGAVLGSTAMNNEFTKWQYENQPKNTEQAVLAGLMNGRSSGVTANAKNNIGDWWYNTALPWLDKNFGNAGTAKKVETWRNNYNSKK